MAAMAANSKEKLVAAGEAGFASIESSTLDKPRGTFVLLIEPVTPRRSPRFALLPFTFFSSLLTQF